MGDTPESLLQLQREAVQNHGDRRLFGSRVDGVWSWTTYAEFGALVDGFRAGLASRGVEAGDAVACISENRMEWAVAAYATFGLGATFVPMYVGQSSSWRHILDDSFAKVLCVSTKELMEATEPMVGAVGGLKSTICFGLPAGYEASFAFVVGEGHRQPVATRRPDPDDVCTVTYTAGTTGAPKGAMLTHRNLVANVLATLEVLPLTSTDVSCSALPWAHAFGQTAELHTMLASGGAMAIAGGADSVLEDVRQVEPTVLFGMPRTFRSLYDQVQQEVAEASWLRKRRVRRAQEVSARRRELAAEGHRSRWLDLRHLLDDRSVYRPIRARLGGRLRLAVSGGASLPAELATFLDEAGVAVCEGYGLTEAGPVVTVNTPGARRLGTAGRPLPGVEVAIFDASGDPVPVGREGEIHVAGPSVMSGYLNLRGATADALVDRGGVRMLRTGDLGRVDSAGYLTVTGRLGEMYTLQTGEAVLPTSIEDHLALSGLIDRAFVYGEDKPFNVCLVAPDLAAVERRASAEGLGEIAREDLPTDERVHAWIGEELERMSGGLEGHVKPQRWAVVDGLTPDNDLVTGAAGLKRRHVVQRFADQLQGMYAS